LLNGGFIVFVIPRYHERLLKGEMRRWYMVDVGRPLAAALPVIALGKWALPQHLGSVSTIAYIAGLGLCAAVAALLAAPLLRARALSVLNGSILALKAPDFPRA
jgi:hypothetical protein